MRLGMVVEGIIGAAGKGDREEARGLCRKLIEGLRTGGELTPEEGCAAADALRNVRAFDSLEELGRELTARGEARPKVRRLLGQALIERGEIAEALDVLSQLRDDEVKGSEEWAEATGLMGRALKDQVLAAPDKTDARTRDVLRRAIARYHEAYAHDPGKVWQG